MLLDQLTILHSDNGIFKDYSDALEDYGRDAVSLPIVAAQDYLYIGLYKPFSYFYIENKTVNASPRSLTIEYFDGGAWQETASRDQTLGCKRNGFVFFDMPSLWAANTVNLKSLFWIRLKWDLDFDLLYEMQGLNLIWSDDHDLVEEYDDILQMLPENYSSFILKHQAAKKDIIQAIRNQGKRKEKTRSLLAHITQFDFIRPMEELRQASKYLTLNKIFENVSDSVEDKWADLAKKYKDKFSESFDSLILTLDRDDDGIADESEDNSINTITIRRI